jgi:hypothetical protein
MRWVVLVGLAACGGGGGGGEKTDLTECEGAGDPVLELGDGGLDGFSPWDDGVGVPIEQNGETWGFRVELLTEGVDTTQDVTSFIRYKLGLGGATVDAGATLVLQCPDEGPGWYGVFVPFDEAYQEETAALGLAGEDLILTGTVTDAAGDTATDEVDAVLEAP